MGLHRSSPGKLSPPIHFRGVHWNRHRDRAGGRGRAPPRQGDPRRRRAPRPLRRVPARREHRPLRRLRHRDRERPPARRRSVPGDACRHDTRRDRTRRDLEPGARPGVARPHLGPLRSRPRRCGRAGPRCRGGRRILEIPFLDPARVFLPRRPEGFCRPRRGESHGREAARDFDVAVIPETYRRTTLGSRQAGDRVNFEVDPLSRYRAARRSSR